MSPQPAPAAGGAAAPIRRKHRRLLWIAIAAATAIAAAVFSWHARTLPIQALEVHPLVAEGGPDWLAGAITEEIGDAVRPVTKPAADPKFTAVLEGSVALSGDRVRITARLSRGDGHHYWTRTFERPVTEIARAVAASIIPAARGKASAHAPSPAAYRKHLEARHLFARGDLAKAVDGFDAAAEADPLFAPAFAWAAIGREQMAETGAARPNDLLPAARDDAERAVTLAPEAAEAHLALGIVKMQYDWEWGVARRELDHALQLSPRHPLALRWRERWTEVVNGAAPGADLPRPPRDAESARQLLAQAEDLRSRGYVSPIQFALAAAVAHDADSLFHWLDVAYDERSVQLPSLLRHPGLPQSDPRLRELIRRLKLPATP